MLKYLSMVKYIPHRHTYAQIQAQYEKPTWQGMAVSGQWLARTANNHTTEFGSAFSALVNTGDACTLDNSLTATW